MLGALVSGEGVERIVEITTISLGRPIGLVIPDLEVRISSGNEVSNFAEEWLTGDLSDVPGSAIESVPIEAGGHQYGSVLMMGPGPPHAKLFLNAAAVAALTAIAMDNARLQTERRLGGSLLEELLTRDDMKARDVLGRARHLGSDLSGGAVGLCVNPGGRNATNLRNLIQVECDDALVQQIDDLIYALLPGGFEAAQRVATRLGYDVLVGISSHYGDPNDFRYALEEASLLLDLSRDAEESGDEKNDNDTFRLLFRVLASHPEEMRRFSESTLGPIIEHDEQYSTDLVATLRSYLHEHNCNMNLTAKAMFAHRHTVSNRLSRVQELTGLDPFRSEDRERLGLALKALTIVEHQPDR